MHRLQQLCTRNLTRFHLVSADSVNLAEYLWNSLLQDHLAGKQYLGWLAIREKLTELNEKRKQLPMQLPPPPREDRPSNGRPSEAADDRCVPLLA